MQSLIFYLVLLPTISKFTLSAVLNSTELRNKNLNKSQNHKTDVKIESIDHKDSNLNQNQTGLGDLPKILGKEKVAQIRRNFNLIQKSGLDMISKVNAEETDFDKHNLRKSRTFEKINNQKYNTQLLDDYTLSNLGMSVNTGHGHRKETIDLTQIHRKTVLRYPVKKAKANQLSLEDNAPENHKTGRTGEGGEEGEWTEGIETIKNLGFVTEFFARDGKTNCTEGKYYKRGKCNVCYCAKASEWKPCTKVKCTEQNQLFNEKTILKNSNNEIFYNKLRAEATGCIPGQKLESHHGEKCKCVCSLPSIMECSLCPAVDHIKLSRIRRQKNRH